jgi:uncharacterized membrane protein
VLYLVHPAVVHFALAFAASGAAAEAAGILTRRERLERWGAATLLLGTGCLVVAVATGYLAANTAPNVAGPAERALWEHERLALVAAASFVLLVLWKALGRGRVTGAQRGPYAAALLGALALLLWAGLLGGRLVYDHGVGVAAPAAVRAPGSGGRTPRGSRAIGGRAGAAGRSARPRTGRRRDGPARRARRAP